MSFSIDFIYIIQNNVANNWELKVLRVFGATLLTIHVDLLCWTKPLRGKQAADSIN
jgi:hypothetical protein